MSHMASARKGRDSTLRNQLKSWVDHYIKLRRAKGEHVTKENLEIQWGMAKGTLSRIDSRMGADNFRRIALMVSREKISADQLLFEFPPPTIVGPDKKG